MLVSNANMRQIHAYTGTSVEAMPHVGCMARSVITLDLRHCMKNEPQIYQLPGNYFQQAFCQFEELRSPITEHLTLQVGNSKLSVPFEFITFMADCLL